MTTWVYDGSLEGLILLAHKAYRSGEAPTLVVNPRHAEIELFAPDSAESPAVDPEEVERAARELLAGSRRLYAALLKVWMSEEPIEAAFLALAADLGRRGESALADWSRAELVAVAAGVRRVDREIHRLLGMARFFHRRDGLYCAPLEPDHNILPALLPHFARRFADSGLDFALIDIKRQEALLSRRGRVEELWGETALALLPDGSDAAEVGLWKRYFRATENPSRSNPRLQRRFMPLRYWKHLAELGEVQ